jgi:hypothetical protein
VVKFWQKRACNYANPFMRENTRGYRRKTVNLHVELVSDEAPSNRLCKQLLSILQLNCIRWFWIKLCLAHSTTWM